MAAMNDHKARAHALLSASSAHRWLNCPGSAVAADAYQDRETEYTQEGTLAHEVAEATANRYLTNGPGPDAEADGVTGEMLSCAIDYAVYIQENSGPDATVLLEQRVDFSYWVPQGFGTADCIIIRGDTIKVIDYKYGQGVPVSAVDNPQMKLYALGAYSLLGDLFDLHTVEMHIFQPRLDSISTDTMTVKDLLSWAENTVKPIAAQAVKGEGGYNAGSWCKFCPHAGRCRELTHICTEYVSTHQMRVAVPVLAPLEVAEVLELEPLITLWLKRVKDQAMITLLDGGEIPGYKVVEGKLGNRKWADEIKVADLLKANGYQTEDITETKLLSPAAMDKAIGKKRAAELLTDLIDRAPGAPTIVPETDKRPPLDRLGEAQKDFQ